VPATASEEEDGAWCSRRGEPQGVGATTTPPSPASAAAPPLRSPSTGSGAVSEIEEPVGPLRGVAIGVQRAARRPFLQRNLFPNLSPLLIFSLSLQHSDF
jgi:hypothetical protein